MTLYIKTGIGRRGRAGRAREGEDGGSRRSVRVIKDMRGDRDGLARTPVKVLMVAGHTAFPFSLCECVR